MTGPSPSSLQLESSNHPSRQSSTGILNLRADPLFGLFAKFFQIKLALWTCKRNILGWIVITLPYGYLGDVFGDSFVQNNVSQKLKRVK